MVSVGKKTPLRALVVLPVPIRAMAEGQTVRVVRIGIGGCLCECGHDMIGVWFVSEMTDFEPLTP